jgi:RNA polymerase sigma factor (sigma-70 family)
MNDLVRPPDEGDDAERVDHADDATRAPERPPPPTAYEHLLVRTTGDVVVRSANWCARKFPNFVHDHGVMSKGDLMALGIEALYRAARVYSEKENPEFAAFARFYVRGAMLNAIDDLFFEERIKRAAAQAEYNFCAYFVDPDYNVMKHDGLEARRRYRSFANGVLAATFAAAIEEAKSHLDEAELSERADYEHAIATLHTALAKLTDADRQLLALAYRDLMNLKAAASELGIPYGTARAPHARALKLLHEHLVQAGITRAPRPLVAPDGGALEARAPPPQNDTEPGADGVAKTDKNK